MLFMPSYIVVDEKKNGCLYTGRYVGEPMGNLTPGCTVDVYPLATFERRARAETRIIPASADCKILVSESGEGLFARARKTLKSYRRASSACRERLSLDKEIINGEREREAIE